MEQKNAIRPYQAAVEQIEWYIRTNKLPPHTRLPGEREMSEMWKINRSTLRAAIRRLVAERRLYSEKGSGTYVAPPKLERNLQDMKSTSEFIRGTGYFLWTEVIDSRVLKCDRYLAQKLEIPAGSQVFCLRRLRLKNNIPLMIENCYLDYKRCPGIEAHNFAEESLYRVLKGYGVCPAQGQERVSITYATEEEAGHLKVEAGQFLFYLSGTMKDADQKPVEFFRIVARPDQIRFTSTLRHMKSDSERSI